MEKKLKRRQGVEGKTRQGVEVKRRRSREESSKSRR
jgi:hypothetical protein